MEKDLRQRQEPLFHEKSEPTDLGQHIFSSKKLVEPVTTLGTDPKPPADVASVVADELPQSVTGLRICVVEDSYKNLRAIFDGLANNGHELDHFANAEDALSALEREHYDAVIVSDTIEGGLRQCSALILQLRRDSRKKFSTLPILALTLDSSESVQYALRSAGASEVVAKWSSNQLNSLLSEAMSNNQAPPPLQSKRVLLLEDSYRLSVLLTDALVGAGHDVTHVVAPEEALTFAKATRYDFFVVGQNDTEADVMSCAQFLKRLHALQQQMGTDTPVIVLASNTEPRNIRSLRLLSADVVLKTNPVHLKQHVLSRVEQRLPNDAAFAPSNTDVGELPLLSMHMEPTLADSAWGKRPSAFKEHPQGTPKQRDSGTALLDRPALKLPITELRTGWRSIAGIAALLVLGFLAGLLGWEQFAERQPVKVTAVKLGTVERKVDVAGLVVSKRQINLPAVQTGQLYRVYVNEGNFVRKGEKLATLDNREALINVRRAEAQLFRYRAEIEFAETSLRDFEKEGQTDSLQQVFDMKASKSLAENKLRVAKQDLQAAQLAVERLAIVAPFAGIAARSYAVEGSWVEAGTTLYTLADLDALEVALQPASVTPAIQLGQVVRFNIDGVEWLEKVQRLSDGDALRPDANGVVAYATLGEEAPLLSFNQQMSGEVIAESKDNSIAVPSGAVFTNDGKSYVAVVIDGKARHVPVVVGIRAPDQVEITQGLNLGDEVILAGRSVEEGQRVLPTMVTSR